MKKNNTNLHVCSEDKFMPPFIDFVKEHFPDASNVYYIRKNGEQLLYDPLAQGGGENGTVLREIQDAAVVVRLLYKSKRIVLHGFTNKYIIIFLAMNPWLHDKCYWSIWGGELYSFKKRKDIPRRVYEVFKARVISGVGNILTYIPGDVDLARNWYGAKGKHIECLMYTSNVVENDKVQKSNSENKAGLLKIMVGNSAALSNRHLYVFEKLKRMKCNRISIISPLSYGDTKYALEVRDKGVEMFGEHFYPMMDFMCYEEYLNFLSDVDIAIFAHERQQAMGNIIMLLAFGKKVYMNKSSTLARMLCDIGLVIFDVDEIDLDPIGEKERADNISIIKERFNVGVLKHQLRAICD